MTFAAVRGHYFTNLLPLSVTRWWNVSVFLTKKLGWSGHHLATHCSASIWRLMGRIQARRAGWGPKPWSIQWTGVCCDGSLSIISVMNNHSISFEYSGTEFCVYTSVIILYKLYILYILSNILSWNDIIWYFISDISYFVFQNCICICICMSMSQSHMRYDIIIKYNILYFILNVFYYLWLVQCAIFLGLILPPVSVLSRVVIVQLHTNQLQLVWTWLKPKLKLFHMKR